MVLGGDRLGVEFVDNVDVGVVDGGNRGGGSRSSDGSVRVGQFGCVQSKSGLCFVSVICRT